MSGMDRRADDVSQDWGAQTYMLTFGRYHGKMLQQVPLKCVQKLEQNTFALKICPGLRAAVEYFYENIFENYRLDFGDHKGKQLHEVPNDYLLMLESGGKKLYKMELLQRAL
jgi:uncharacterized protein (DUF3820 family)